MSEHRLPVLRAEQLIKVLEKLGFIHTRRSPGSHFRFVHPDGRRTTVPVHRGRNLGRGLLRKVLRDIGLSVEELNELLGDGRGREDDGGRG